MIWFPQPGPEGGRTPRGSGPEARRVLRAGRDARTVPAAAVPPVQAARLVPEPPRIEPLAIAAEPAASALEDLPGALIALSVHGAPDGGGTGPGGLGRGKGGPDGVGIGDDGRRSGVTPPRLITQVRPHYTADAMRARIQGIVTLDAVVLPDGSVGEVRVVRSLDATFGLDQEAIKAVRQWRFVPGTRSGRQVPVIISAELTFTLR